MYLRLLTVTTDEVTVGVVWAAAGDIAAGVMPSMMMPSTPLTVPRVPLTTYLAVSPLANLASIFVTEASVLLEPFSSYACRQRATAAACACPTTPRAVKVSLSAADNPTVEPTSATSAMETIDDLFMLPSHPL